MPFGKHSLNCKLTPVNIFPNCSEWSSLTDAQKKYLVPIRPPGDILPLIIREVVDKNEITNAAIVFDSDFGRSSIDIIILRNITQMYFIIFRGI